MLPSKLKKKAVKWGKSAGVLLPKEFIGQDVYILTMQDLEDIKLLKEYLK